MAEARWRAERRVVRNIHTGDALVGQTRDVVVHYARAVNQNQRTLAAAAILLNEP
jgi:hypothetical protein